MKRHRWWDEEVTISKSFYYALLVVLGLNMINTIFWILDKIVQAAY